jgi:hypothetical protein
MSELREWRKRGDHLPPFMRDFHDQKDLFKAIHDLYKLDDVKDHRDPISFVTAMIYTMDSFLWFMAGHGYTLQRCRAKQPFMNVHETVTAAREARDKAFAAMLNQHIESRRAQSEPDDSRS